jgi:hypothetical protein
MNRGSCHGINRRGTRNGTAGPSLNKSNYRFVLNILRGVQGSLKHMPTYFLKRFSNAVRASMGRAELGVEVSFSTRTRME